MWIVLQVIENLLNVCWKWMLLFGMHQSVFGHIESHDSIGFDWRPNVFAFENIDCINFRLFTHSQNSCAMFRNSWKMKWKTVKIKNRFEKKIQKSASLFHVFIYITTVFSVPKRILFIYLSTAEWYEVRWKIFIHIFFFLVSMRRKQEEKITNVESIIISIVICCNGLLWCHPSTVFGEIISHFDENVTI